MTIRAMIVDDEPLGREGVRLRLRAEPGITLVGEYADAGTAIAAIRETPPDLLFLDVQLAGADGFDVLRAVGPGTVPAVVFVTAFDEHAVRAFEEHVLDYLLKPLDDERFRESVRRARRVLDSARGEEAAEGLRAMLGSLQARPPAGGLARLTVREPDGIRFVEVHAIDWIEAAGDSVRLHTAGRVETVRETLGALIRKLDPRAFVRIHRSAVVRVDRIARLRPYFHGDYLVTLKSGEELRASRTHRGDLARALGAEL